MPKVAFTGSRTPAYDGVLELPPTVGGTRCRVTVYLRDQRTPVVIVSELSDNEGPSVSLAFDVVAQFVRAQLPADSGEPLWVQRWPERALAALILRGGRVAATHVLVEQGGAWWRRPVSGPAAAQLLDLASGSPGRAT